MARTARSRPLVGRDLNAKVRQAQCLELRIKGHSQAKIAQTVGLSQPAVSRAIRRALAANEAEDVAELRKIDAQRMEDLHQLAWGYAEQGDMQAAGVIPRLLDRRAHLFGMDAARDGARGGFYTNYQAYVVICATDEAAEVMARTDRELAELGAWKSERDQPDSVVYDATTVVSAARLTSRSRRAPCSRFVLSSRRSLATRCICASPCCTTGHIRAANA